MEMYTDCFVVDKEKILKLFDNDSDKLNVRLEKAKKYHQKSVSEIDQLQAQVKAVVDKFMKEQLQKMSGLVEEVQPLELRKFALTNVDETNFESITLEKLKTLSTDKPIKLQQFNFYNVYMTQIDLLFTDGLETATFKTPKAGGDKYETKVDISKQIKKIALKKDGNYVTGIKFLDEKDNEIVQCEGRSSGSWEVAKELPQGFEIIGIYGNTTKPYSAIQFGFLLWNPKPLSLN